MKQNQQITELVVKKILTKLEQGVNPWAKPWHLLQDNKVCPEYFAYSATTQKAYFGINQAILDPGFYLTFKECKARGGTIRKGAKAQEVIFYKKYFAKATEEQVANFIRKYADYFDNKDSFMQFFNKFFKQENGQWLQQCQTNKTYFVFALEDCEGIDYPEYEKTSLDEQEERDEEIDKTVKNYLERCDVSLVERPSDKAYYMPSTKQVVMPRRNQFETTAEFYQVQFHELTHSTGHKDLLNRKTLTSVESWGDENYSKEELVAEIGSTMLLNYFGKWSDKITDRNASYLKSWASHIHEDKSLQDQLMLAATQAEKAYKLILNLE